MASRGHRHLHECEWAIVKWGGTAMVDRPIGCLPFNSASFVRLKPVLEVTMCSSLFIALAISSVVSAQPSLTMASTTPTFST
jgi:hypothetical protein